MKNSKFKFLPYGAWIVAFTILPLLLLIYYAFTNPSGQFTLDNILRMGGYLDVLLRSLFLAAIATFFCLLIGYPFAYFMSRMSPKNQKTILLVIMIPMWTSLLLRTYAWMTLLENNGLINKLLGLIEIGPFRMINTSGAVVLGMVYDFLPFMILPIYTSMIRIDRSLLEAASDLSAGNFQILRRVILPLSLSGILSGITMVFVPAASTFVISRLLGGGTNLLIGDLIESQFVGNIYNPYFGSALSLLLMVVILLIMAVTRHFEKQEEEMLT